MKPETPKPITAEEALANIVRFGIINSLRGIIKEENIKEVADDVHAAAAKYFQENPTHIYSTANLQAEDANNDPTPQGGIIVTRFGAVSPFLPDEKQLLKWIDCFRIFVEAFVEVNKLGGGPIFQSTAIN